MNLSDAEIIKDCKNCLHYDICLQWSTEPLNNADWCIHFIDENIINRLKAEIEESREKNAGLALALLHEVVNEDERLKNEIVKVAKSEARKEFVAKAEKRVVDVTLL